LNVERELQRNVNEQKRRSAVKTVWTFPALWSSCAAAEENHFPMAKLLIKTDGVGDQVIELKMGANRFGRSPKNDFQLDHATISSTHCEIVLSDSGVTVRDCGSTNGTFADGKRIEEAALSAGQVLRLGDVELLVENTEATIAIPKFEVERPAPPVVRSDGSLLCRRHDDAPATHQCTFCHEILCDACVKRMRRRGGKVLKLCPLCSHQVIRLGPEKKRKRSFLAFLQKTVKLPWARQSKDADE
jgi:hypothetical protein